MFVEGLLLSLILEAFIMYTAFWGSSCWIFEYAFVFFDFQVVACGLLYRPLAGSPGGRRLRPIKKQDVVDVNKIESNVNKDSSNAVEMQKLTNADTVEIEHRGKANVDEFQPMVGMSATHTNTQSIGDKHAFGDHKTNLDYGTADESSQFVTNETNGYCMMSEFCEKDCTVPNETVERCPLNTNDPMKSADGKYMYSQNGASPVSQDIGSDTQMNTNNAAHIAFFKSFDIF